MKRLAPAVGVLVVLLLFLGATVPAQDQRPPVFRGRIALVPLDVRVLDKDGNPVRDLDQSDFEILENGVAQTISLFSIEERLAHQLNASVHRDITTPTSPRTFVIALGRGRLQGPAKGFDALFDFIDRRIAPDDRLGVVAYDRVTELTTDRHAVKRLLERYRDRHEQIEAVLDHWFRGLTAFFGSPDPPTNVQRNIDALFDAPGLPAFRQLVLLPVTEPGEFSADRQEVLESLGRSDDGSRRGLVYNVAARQDFEKLQAAIDYLQHLDGEKHLILVSPDGLGVLRPTLPEQIARLATDARVTLSVIQTGGIPTSWIRSGDTMIFQGPSWNHIWANANSRLIAEETGGVASIYAYAANAFDKIERSTRVVYLLGYYPADSTLDGRYRKVTVNVRRPNLRVLYRRGYYARREPEFADRRAALTASRIAAAQGYRAIITDIPVELSATVEPGPGGISRVLTRVRLGPAAVSLPESGGRRGGSLEVALFVGASNEKQIGELRKRIDLNLTPDNYTRLTEHGVEFAASIEVTGRTRYVKAVVYDSRSDRLGSAVFEVR